MKNGEKMEKEKILTRDQLNKAISRKIETAPTKTDAKKLIIKTKSKLLFGTILTSLILIAVWKTTAINIFASFLLFVIFLFGVFYCLVLSYSLAVSKKAYSQRD